MQSQAQPFETSGGTIAARVMRGSAALFLVSVVNIVGQLATLPVAMRYWGPAHYGEWVVLSGAVTFLTLADLGIQSHVINVMSACYARHDQRAFLDALHSAVRFQFILVSGLLCVGGALAGLFPIERWLAIRSASPLDVRLAVLLLGIELLLSIPMGIINGSYRATGHLARAALISIGQRVFFFAAPLAAICLGATFATVAAIRVAVSFLFTVIIIVDLRRLLPWWHLRPLLGSLRNGLGMLAPGLLFVLLVFSDYLSQQSAIFILQHVTGPEVVSRFTTHRTTVNVARMLSGMLTTAMWTEITALEARSQQGTLLDAHRALTRMNAWLVGGATILIIPVGQYLYGAWTLRKLDLDPVTLGMLGLQTLLWGAWTAGATVLTATNRPGQIAGVLLLDAALATTLSALLAPHFGMRGCALGALLADLFVASWLTPLAAIRAVHDRARDFVRSVGPFLFWGVLLPAGGAYSLWRWCPLPVIGAGLAALLGLAASAVLGWRGLEERERVYVMQLLTDLRRRLDAR